MSDRLDEACAAEGLSGGGNHYGIVDDEGPPPARRNHFSPREKGLAAPPFGYGRRECFRHHIGDLYSAQHADLNRRNSEVVKHHLDLCPNDSDWRVVDRQHPARIVRGERSDHSRGVDAERRECLKIGLNPGAAARIRAGDGEGDRQSLIHIDRVAATHSRARLSGLALSVMSVTTETMSAPAARHSFA